MPEHLLPYSGLRAFKHLPGEGCALGLSLQLPWLGAHCFIKAHSEDLLGEFCLWLQSLLASPAGFYLWHFNTLGFAIVYDLCGSDSRPKVGYFFCKGLDIKYLKLWAIWGLL